MKGLNAHISQLLSKPDGSVNYEIHLVEDNAKGPSDDLVNRHRSMHGLPNKFRSYNSFHNSNSNPDGKKNRWDKLVNKNNSNNSVGGSHQNATWTSPNDVQRRNSDSKLTDSPTSQKRQDRHEKQQKAKNSMFQALQPIRQKRSLSPISRPRLSISSLKPSKSGTDFRSTWGITSNVVVTLKDPLKRERQHNQLDAEPSGCRWSKAVPRTASDTQLVQPRRSRGMPVSRSVVDCLQKRGSGQDLLPRPYQSSVLLQDNKPLEVGKQQNAAWETSSPQTRAKKQLFQLLLAPPAATNTTSMTKSKTSLSANTKQQLFEDMLGSSKKSMGSSSSSRSSSRKKTPPSMSSSRKSFQDIVDR
jgi:Spy/CpxP family protein refolding chaperone